MKKKREFWLLIDLATKEALPASQQPKSAAMADVSRFVNSLRSTLRITIGIVAVFPGSYWEEAVPEGGFPIWYQDGEQVDPNEFSGGR